MTEIKIYCLEDQQENDIVTTLGEGEHPIGRGGTLKCSDKKVSRNHAVIIVHESEVLLKSTHINPSFYKAANGKAIQLLKKDDSVPLEDGDQFALLADKFWFKIKIEHTQNSATASPIRPCKRSNAEEDDESCKRFKNTSHDETSEFKALDPFSNTNSLSNNLASINKEDYAESITENSEMTRKDLSAEDFRLNDTKENDEVQASSDQEQNRIPLTPPTKCEDSKKNEATDDLGGQKLKKETIKDAKNDISDDSDESIDLAAPIEPKKNFWGITNASENKGDEDHGGSNSNEASNIPSSSTVASNSNDTKPTARRERCWYATTCYRKNPAHRTQFSHPGDDDFDSDPADDRPQCQYGAACYRKNADHRKEFRHSQQPMQKTQKNKNDSQKSDGDVSDDEEDSTDDGRNGRKRSAAKKVTKYQETPEDDYDMQDPFINDGSSDDFQPSSEDDDTDWEDSQNVDEESEGTRRLLKEAKKFTKVKKKK